MSFLKNIFSKKENPIHSVEDFWNWFQSNEKTFFKVVKEHGKIEKEFFNKLAPKLNDLRDDIFYLTGMFDDNTVELIITPEGVVKNIAFVEELVKAAPIMKGWKFTALKPEMDINDTSIEMAGYKFGIETLWFYANENSAYPDEIDIRIVHTGLTEKNKPEILNGTYIFMDNYLGELNFVTSVDNLTVVSKKEAQKELVSIDKLKAYLIWREKEFIEKYEGVRYDTEKDSYSILEAEMKSGNKLIAAINTDLLKWDRKASHPWIAVVEIKFDGKNSNGMPDKEDMELMEEIENKIMEGLKDFEGYLNVGRQTADSEREIYFACNDFRKASIVINEVVNAYSNQTEISFDIYKDKYWKSFERYTNN